MINLFGNGAININTIGNMYTNDDYALALDLVLHKQEAIDYLYEYVIGYVVNQFSMITDKRQKSELIEKVLNLSTSEMIYRIRERRYKVQPDARLTTYYMGIIRNKVAEEKKDYIDYVGLDEIPNAVGEPIRSKKMMLSDDMSKYDRKSDDEYSEDNELLNAIKKELPHLGNPCEQIILLKYIAEKRDREIIERNLVPPYTTTDALRTRRSQCMRELRERLAEKGITADTF